MSERPGHGLDEYLAKLNMLPKAVHVQLVGGSPSGMTRDGVAQPETFDALVDRVARRMADKQDRGL